MNEASTANFQSSKVSSMPPDASPTPTQCNSKANPSYSLPPASPHLQYRGPTPIRNSRADAFTQPPEKVMQSQSTDVCQPIHISSDTSRNRQQCNGSSIRNSKSEDNPSTQKQDDWQNHVIGYLQRLQEGQVQILSGRLVVVSSVIRLFRY